MRGPRSSTLFPCRTLFRGGRGWGVGDGGRVGRLAAVLGGVRVEVGEGRDRVRAGVRAGVAELGLAGGVGLRGGGAGAVLAEIGRASGRGKGRSRWAADD